MALLVSVVQGLQSSIGIAHGEPCMWACRIAFGVVLAGMGPKAEPFIQILETANDVIMRLVLAQSPAALCIGLLRSSSLAASATA